MAEPTGIDAVCMACDSAECHFKPRKFFRRPVGEYDVLFDVVYCGVCHSDLHIAAGHLNGVMKTTYPCTPGHELAGICTAVGEKVTKFKVGDHVGVGCMVDSCLNCSSCNAGDEQKCKKQVQTYQGVNQNGRAATYPAGEKTIGGYSTKMVVTEHFGIKIPQEYPLECAGPVMCAGITMYDPLKKLGCGPGSRVGIIGLGGLGIMGVKIAVSMGATVTAIGRAPNKEHLAKKAGADKYVASTDPAQMKDAEGYLDIILNTIPVGHDWTVYEKLLTNKGKQVLLGLHASLIGAMLASGVTCGRSQVMASGIGGINNTQEVIDLCAKNGIKPDVELKAVEDLTAIYEALDAGNDQGKRFVLDIQGSLKETASVPQAPKLSPSQSNIRLSAIFSEFLYMVGRAWFRCCASRRND